MKKILLICTGVLILALIAVSLVFILKDNKKEIPTLTSSVPESSAASSAKPQPTLAFIDFEAPKAEAFATEAAFLTFTGKSNTEYALKLNNNVITLNSDGTFSINQELKIGLNKFVFTNGDVAKTFKITRNYAFLKSFSPSTEQTYSAGAKFEVKVNALKGSSIIAKFNGQSITLNSNSDGEFVDYVGSFTLPSGHFKDINLGKVVFTCSYKGYTKTLSSKNIICQKENGILDSDISATPTGGQYVNVGSGIISEIVAYEAETFSANTKKDISDPRNNYLPKGTVDYGSANYETVTRDGQSYQLITLRCGRKVYISKVDKTSNEKLNITKQYVGKLPDTNQITFNSFENGSSHTVLTLDTAWKAPFYFQLKEQNFNNDFTVTDITYTHIDITFCYASSFEGELKIPAENPLFSSAEIIKNQSDYTLRLHLEKQGAFYGWDSYYNANGQLCFEFLNPKKIALADNQYGADLTGVKVLIDVGHGGKDPGALGVGNKNYTEAYSNLYLAQKIAANLRSIGATVYLNRNDNSISLPDTKIRLLKTLKPDYCIAIHHDSSTRSSLNGFGAYYFQPFAKSASNFVLNHSFNTGIYKDKTFKFHYYYMARSSVCPVVLTENGYMSNPFDFENIKSDTANEQKAVAITKGIAEYFISIQ